jgi:hypothetical protein
MFLLLAVSLASPGLMVLAALACLGVVGMALGAHQGSFDASAIADIQAGFSFTGLFNELAQDNIVATGNSQATAFQATGQTIRILTAAAGTGILLPPSAAGLEVLVINHGANACQIYGNGTDTIDDIATATGVSQMMNSLVIYTCATAGKWYSEGLSTGFATLAGLQTLSSQDTITAKSGGGQYAPGAGPAVNKLITRVTIVAAANDSLTLPVSQAGMTLYVINAAAANSMNVFPGAGEQINVLGANAAFAVAANKMAVFVAASAGQWQATVG